MLFIVILLLSYLVIWDRCGDWLYRFLILAVFPTFINILYNFLLATLYNIVLIFQTKAVLVM